MAIRNSTKTRGEEVVGVLIIVQDQYVYIKECF